MTKSQITEILKEVEVEIYDNEQSWSEYMIKREMLLLVAKKLNVTL